MKATDKKIEQARAAGVARLAKMLDKASTDRERAVIGRGVAGWRLAHTDGSAMILIADASPVAPAEPDRAPLWRWIARPQHDARIVPEAGALAAGVRFMRAASRGQHSTREPVSVHWRTAGGALRLEYARPGWQCEEACAVVPALDITTRAPEVGGWLDLDYLAPLLDAANVDGWTWFAGSIGAVRAVELGAEGVRVVVCELRAPKDNNKPKGER